MSTLYWFSTFLIESTAFSYRAPRRVAASSKWGHYGHMMHTHGENRRELNALSVSTSSSSSSALETEVAAQTQKKSSSVVDMNQYNLASLEEIAQEWTAELRSATSMMEGGVMLGAKSSKEIFADTEQVVFRRRAGEGLGISLLEIAGGREDGLGITIVDGLVEGGAAEGCGILEGDSISQISIRRKFGDALSSTIEEVFAVPTECLGYDSTVDAILSIPPIEEDDNAEEVFVITVKRLRRKPKVLVNLMYPPSQGEEDVKLELFAGENLRRALLTRGIKLNDPLARRFDSGGQGTCAGEGTCTTCVVDIVKGAELLNEPKTQEKQMVMKVHPKWRLGCKAIVGQGMQSGEMTIKVNPRQW